MALGVVYFKEATIRTADGNASGKPVEVCVVGFKEATIRTADGNLFLDRARELGLCFKEATIRTADGNNLSSLGREINMRFKEATIRTADGNARLHRANQRLPPSKRRRSARRIETAVDNERARHGGTSKRRRSARRIETAGGTATGGVWSPFKEATIRTADGNDCRVNARLTEAEASKRRRSARRIETCAPCSGPASARLQRGDDPHGGLKLDQMDERKAALRASKRRRSARRIETGYWSASLRLTWRACASASFKEATIRTADGNVSRRCLFLVSVMLQRGDDPHGGLKLESGPTLHRNSSRFKEATIRTADGNCEQLRLLPCLFDSFKEATIRTADGNCTTQEGWWMRQSLQRGDDPHGGLKLGLGAVAEALGRRLQRGDDPHGGLKPNPAPGPMARSRRFKEATIRTADGNNDWLWDSDPEHAFKEATIRTADGNSHPSAGALCPRAVFKEATIRTADGNFTDVRRFTQFSTFKEATIRTADGNAANVPAPLPTCDLQRGDDPHGGLKPGADPGRSGRAPEPRLQRGDDPHGGLKLVPRGPRVWRCQLQRGDDPHGGLKPS